MNLPLLAALDLNTTVTIAIAVLVLVLFGAKKLPMFIRSLGESMDDFRKGKEEFEKRLARIREEIYWNQYDAEDKNPKWTKHVPAAPDRPLWPSRRSWSWKRLRVIIVARV